MARDWANLQSDLLRTIADLLTISVADYIRFRAVCTTWQSSTPQTPPKLPIQPPFLLLPPQNHRSLFVSLAPSNKAHTFSLPHPPSTRLGSSLGWLPFLDPTTASLSLLNPVTQSRIHLPSLLSFPDVVSLDVYAIGREYSIVDDGMIRHVSLQEMCRFFIKKIVLSSNPALHPNYVVIALMNHTGKLGWCKNGDESWKYIDDAQSYYEDAIFRDNLLYAVDKFGNIAICDVHCSIPTVSIIMIEIGDWGDLQYLVTSSKNNLLFITRYMEPDYVDRGRDNGYKTTKFEVFRLDGVKWEHVKYLGDDAIFLGGNSTLALSSRGLRGYIGNCIYYTDDCSEYDNENLYGDPDLGIYDLGTGNTDSLPGCSHDSYSPRLQPPPVWVTPYPFL